uniref:Uncharacterized protein n=1 Tax=viral metagenome TaxID=1070528 RepID=A0A6M3L8D1_9ZZZZ
MKTKNKALLNLVKNLLYARRNGNIKTEQYAYDRLNAKCNSMKIDMGICIQQGIDYMKKNDVAAIMNSIL